MAEAATKLPVKSEKSAASASVGNRTSPFETLRREIDRLFDDLHPFGWRLPSTRSMFEFEAPTLRAEWPIAPAIDLVENKDEYEITAELPGIDEKNVEIKLSDRTLTIKGEKTEEKEEKEKDYYLSERRYGSFQRSFQLPEGVDIDRIDATFAKGVLTVKLPKTAEAQKVEKKIAVKPA
jgi:HSP20 family protein